MGLSFQNKKSWHPGSFKNIAEVWAAEEKKSQLEKYWQEIKKKRIEEKYSEELKKLQVEAGILPESALNSMEWMYKGCDVADQKNNAEEFLLGKPVEAKKPEFAQPQSKEDNAKYKGFKDDTVNKQNEDFIKVREDPQFEMRKEEIKRKEEIMNNPMIMQNLYRSQESESNLISSKSKKSKKDKKKKSKKEKSEKKSKHRKSDKSKKDNKKKRSRRHDDSEESSDHSRSRSRSRSRNSSGESEDSTRKHRSLSKSKKDKKKEKSHKKDSKLKTKSVERKSSGEAASEEESNNLFNEYIRNRLGPLVHFDEKDFRLTFLARKTFKDNDQRNMQPMEREKMLEMMRKNAHEYREQQTSVLDKTKDADDFDVADYDKKARTKTHNQQAYGMNIEANVNSLGENINRGKYFVNKKVVRDDCNTYE